MEAGRDLDALIAEKVMGYQWARIDPKIWTFDHPWVNVRSLRPVGYSSWTIPADMDLPIHFDDSHIPAYSADIAVAWLVVAQMATLGYWCQMRTPFEAHGGPDCWAGFTPHSTTGWNGTPDHWTQAETLPMVICLAALKTIDEA